MCLMFVGFLGLDRTLTQGFIQDFVVLECLLALVTRWHHSGLEGLKSTYTSNTNAQDLGLHGSRSQVPGLIGLGNVRACGLSIKLRTELHALKDMGFAILQHCFMLLIHPLPAETNSGEPSPKARASYGLISEKRIRPPPRPTPLLNPKDAIKVPQS